VWAFNIVSLTEVKDLFKFFPERWTSGTYPKLDWIQVEISSYCNANCIYCPQAAYRNNWQQRYLPLEVFRRLIPAFRKTGLVYLQGWGEPFTHRGFLEMLRVAKHAGCRVGTTTNGTLLNRDLIEKLVNEGLDVIGFSLAGVDAKNDAIRKGTYIKAVLGSVEELHRAKAKYGSNNPRIHLAYMLLRSGLEDLEKLPGFLATAGADQTVVSSLSLVVDPALENEAVLASGEKAYLDLKDRLMDVGEGCAALGAHVHFHIVSPLKQDFRCSENVTQAVVVGSNGSLSPCVMKQIPAAGDNFHYFKGEKCQLEKLDFGNIIEESLHTVWHKKSTQSFLRKIRNGDPPQACRNCWKGWIDNSISHKDRAEEYHLVNHLKMFRA
jgi:MoaA/NifB/PqqE/SkfB family radical SAM enzyme